MKLIVVGVLVALATVTVQERMDEQMQSDLNACKASEGASQADVDLIKKHQEPTSKAGKCLVGCLFEKRGFIKNGAFDRAAADAHAQKNFNNAQMLANVIKNNAACEKEVAGLKDKCVTGPKLQTCLDKNKPAPKN